MVPPPSLVSLCFDKLQVERALGTLVVPEWESVPYWVKLVDETEKFVPCVAETEILPL